MSPTQPYDPVDLILSLRGSLCPGCQAGKMPYKAFCLECYKQLSRETQAGLHRAVRCGYESAFGEAMRVLGVGRGDMSKSWAEHVAAALNAYYSPPPSPVAAAPVAVNGELLAAAKAARARDSELHPEGDCVCELCVQLDAAIERATQAPVPDAGREAAAMASGWQPISTAPKDKEVLLFFGNRATVGAWIGDSIVHKRSLWMGNGGWALEPTHWAPLPEPPLTLSGGH